MFFALHTTKGIERQYLLSLPGTEIEIDPAVFHKHPIHKPVVWEEDSGEFYIHPTDEFFQALKEIDEERFNPAESAYVKRWAYKGEEPLARMSGLATLYRSIKDHGIREPVHCTLAGERLDGSFRTKIAMHLGIKKVKAIVHSYDWRDVNADYLLRKLESRKLSSGPDYYSFDYGNGWWNIRAGQNYVGNAKDRWEVLQKYITGKSVLDLGCNEGYIGLQCALAGMRVRGYDHDWTHVAYLNKLVYGFINQRDLNIEFFEKDITEVRDTADTVLILNVIYHLPRDKQVEFLAQYKGKNVVMQCNLDKEKERDTYFGSHPDDLRQIIDAAGLKVVEEVEWKNKPIIIAK